MNDVAAYFESAKTASPEHRRLGIEVETLFVGSDGHPLRRDEAETIFAALEVQGWEQREDLKAVGRELHHGGFSLKPEVGAGNLELISPPRPAEVADTLVDDMLSKLAVLYAAASGVGGRPLFEPHDGAPDVDNIILDNERDHQWSAIDGHDALRGLGHIASVHLTIDLCSVEEAFEVIPALNALARRRRWPPESVVETWDRYLERSRCTYDVRRFGPAPETFDDYTALIESFRVVVDRRPDGTLLAPDCPKPLAEMESDVDLPTFLGTVWLHTRLRRLSGALVLETRFIPRGSDDALRQDIDAVLKRILG